jgi:hypothetical protein
MDDPRKINPMNNLPVVQVRLEVVLLAFWNKKKYLILDIVNKLLFLRNLISNMYIFDIFGFL